MLQMLFNTYICDHFYYTEYSNFNQLQNIPPSRTIYHFRFNHCLWVGPIIYLIPLIRRSYMYSSSFQIRTGQYVLKLTILMERRRLVEKRIWIEGKEKG